MRGLNRAAGSAVISDGAGIGAMICVAEAIFVGGRAGRAQTGATDAIVIVIVVVVEIENYLLL